MQRLPFRAQLFSLIGLARNSNRQPYEIAVCLGLSLLLCNTESFSTTLVSFFKPVVSSRTQGNAEHKRIRRRWPYESLASHNKYKLICRSGYGCAYITGPKYVVALACPNSDNAIPTPLHHVTVPNPDTLHGGRGLTLFSARNPGSTVPLAPFYLIIHLDNVLASGAHDAAGRTSCS